MPAGDITVYAFLEAAPGKIDELLATLTRSQAWCENHEPGCLQYRISQDPKDPHKVCVFEVYKDRAALDFHIASDASKANVAFYAAGGLTKPLEEQDIRIHTEYRASA
ncbi:hypothetical protein T439DRAFT_330062 [Meredithblackwellia eburnea MCA 4105]